jgi:hypothetical protein
LGSERDRSIALSLLEDFAEILCLRCRQLTAAHFIELCVAQQNSIHVAKSVTLPSILPLLRAGQNKLAYATLISPFSVV